MSTPDLGIDGITDAEEVGRGGFAVVYRARQEAFHRDVAVKVLTHRPDPDDQARFEREVRAMGALGDHPSIVPLHDAGTTAAGRPYLLMPFLPGGSYQDVLDGGTRLSWREAFEVGVTLAGALQAAHDQGVLHRDLKPANVLLGRYANPMLADFGIARVVGAHETTTGVVTASIAHAAPEILDGRRPTARSDVYGLASTVYALISGRGPFVAESDDSMLPLITRTMRDPVPVLPGVPGDAQQVLADAMAKSADRRPDSATALGEGFAAALAGRVPARPTAAPVPAAASADDGGRVTAVHDPSTLPPVGPLGQAATAPPADRRRVLVGGAVALLLILVAAVAIGRDRGTPVTTADAATEAVSGGTTDTTDATEPGTASAGAVGPVLAVPPTPTGDQGPPIEDLSLTGGVDTALLRQVQQQLTDVAGTLAEGTLMLQLDGGASAVLRVPVPQGGVLRAFTDTDAIDPALAVFTPDGLFVAADDDTGGGDTGANALLDLRLQRGGDHLLVVTNLDDQPGIVDVGVVITQPRPLRAGGNDGALAPDQPAQSWLLPVGPDGPPGDVLRMTAQAYDAALRLVDDRGRVLALSSGGVDAAIDVSRLPAGTYVLMAAADDDDPPPGPYRIDVS